MTIILPIRFLLAISFAGLLFACTTTSDVGRLDESLSEDYVPLEEEAWAMEQAELFHEEFERQGLIYGDPKIRAYVGYLEQRLLSGRAEMQGAMEFYVLRSPAPNALSLPNGNIYVHAGLFSALTSEGQVAAVLCHEIAHVTERHSLKSIIARKNTLIGAHIGDLVTGGLGLVYLGAAANFMQFSREQESEADREAIRCLSRAGYRPEAMVEAFQSLSQFPELKHVKQSIYSSHPSYQRRIEEIRQMAAAMPPPSGPEVHDPRFEPIRRQMLDDSIAMRLRHRQFQLALNALDQAGAALLDEAKFDFYRGEVYRGFYRYPEDAAQEYTWIQTGKFRADDVTLARFQDAREKHLGMAIESYQASARHDPPFPKSLRRLGELMEVQGDYPSAIQFYEAYLRTGPSAGNRMPVEAALTRLRGQ
jgi:predicted Zn-dependent protease